jgi:thiol-disulfide isomerase/thioredoxin
MTEPATTSRNPRNRWIVLGVLALVVVVAGAIALASGGGGDSGGSTKTAADTAVETASVTVEGTALPRFADTGTDPAIGDTIPTLTGRSFDSSPVTVGPAQKPQVIVFVAHWCPHCQAEVPRIVSLAQSGAFRGIRVATVATGTNPTYPNYPPSSWLAREHWPFSVMVDSTRQTAAGAFGLPAYPYFVFVDAQGRVVGRATGEITPSDLTKILRALAAGAALPLKGGANSVAS